MIIQEYKLVAEVMFYKFEEEVNELLQNGWKLHGAPFSSAGNHTCQALIRNQEVPGAWG